MLISQCAGIKINTRVTESWIAGLFDITTRVDIRVRVWSCVFILNVSVNWLSSIIPPHHLYAGIKNNTHITESWIAEVGDNIVCLYLNVRVLKIIPA